MADQWLALGEWFAILFGLLILVERAVELAVHVQSKLRMRNASALRVRPFDWLIDAPELAPHVGVARIYSLRNRLHKVSA